MDIANRIALQKMETENYFIKNLIVSLGISAASVKRFLQLADQNIVADRKVAILAAMGRLVEAPLIVSCKSPCSKSLQVTSSVSTEGKGSVERPLLNDNVQLASTIPPQESTAEQQKCTISPLCKKSTTD